MSQAAIRYPAKPPRSSLGRLCVGLSAKVNYELALHRPGRMPYVVMTEFPASGGNWIRDMLGDVLQLPVPRFSRLPVTHSAIIHSHDARRQKGQPSVYVFRDGRDVFLSHFHKSLKTVSQTKGARQRRFLRQHPSLETFISSGGDRDQVDLLAFFEEWCHRPIGSKRDWGTHIRTWLETPPDRSVSISYEDMQTDAVETLGRAVEELTGTKPDQALLDFAAFRNSFAFQTGRDPGVVDEQSSKRQGVSGKWRSDLPESVQAAFTKRFALELDLCTRARRLT